jgi:hypothetical protein
LAKEVAAKRAALIVIRTFFMDVLPFRFDGRR